MVWVIFLAFYFCLQGCYFLLMLFFSNLHLYKDWLLSCYTFLHKSNFPEILQRSTISDSFSNFTTIKHNFFLFKAYFLIASFFVLFPHFYLNLFFVSMVPVLLNTFFFSKVSSQCQICSWKRAA